ncbi:MAG: hypothetical protein R8K49_05610 [Mariprofundaceae bacterium]
MNLTLAMGLQYNSKTGAEVLPNRSEGSATAPIKEFIAAGQVSLEETQAVIDVQPIESEADFTVSAGQKYFDYLSYNLHAGLVFLPAIGRQLNLTA